MEENNTRHPNPKLSVVVPVFNEADLVLELVDRLENTCRALEVPYELVLVNDGSRDATGSLLFNATEKHPSLIVLELSRNFGHMSAVTAGLRHSRGEAIVLIDGDLQDPPEIIASLVGAYREGVDLVLAHRTRRGEGLLQRYLTTLFYRFFAAVSATQLPHQVGTCCLMSRRVADAILAMPERVRFFAGLRSWVGFNSVSIDYDRPKRRNGKSQVGLWGQFKLARSGIVSFSSGPLLWIARLSFVASFGLFCFGLVVIGIKLFSNLAIPGWASTMVLTGFAAALNAAVLAVIAEYLAVIFDEIKNRPHCLVAAVYRHGAVCPPGEQNTKGRS